MTGLIQNFQYNVPIKKLFKYISSVRQILGIIPAKKKCSESDVLVHVFPQKLVSVTLSFPASSINASSS